MSYVDYPYENQLLCEENKQLRAEVTEQARLLGISAERELALRAEHERLERELAKAKNDAERYRFIRSEWFREDDQNSWLMETATSFFESPNEMDESIDQHIESRKGNDGRP
jgi:hypothetical protein